MGILKAIEMDTGHENSYHKIDGTTLRINAIKLGGTVKVFSYKDHAARLDNKKPAVKTIIVIPDNTMTSIFVGSDNLYQATYRYLKTLPQFSGATDLV